MPIPSEDDLLAPADDAATPAAPEAVVDDPNVLVAVPNNRFFWVFYPEHRGNWIPVQIQPGEGVAEDEVGTWWVCQPVREELRPGVNGYRTIPRGAHPSAAYDLAHSAITRAGGIVLDPVRYRYAVSRPCRHPRNRAVTGDLWYEAFARPRKAIPGRKITFDYDRQRYYRFLLSLVRDGVIPAPDPHLIDVTVASVARRIDRATTRTDLREDEQARAIEAASAVAAVAQSATIPSEAPRASRRRATPAPAGA